MPLQWRRIAEDPANRVAAKISGAYVAIGALWIGISDRLVARVASGPGAETWLQTYKGWLYVAITGALLFWLVRRYARSLHRLLGRLRASERRFRRIVETVPDVLYTADPDDLSRVFINPAASAVLGFSPEESRADPELWSRQVDDAPRVLADIRAQLEAMGGFTAEYRMWHRDGATRRWFQDRGVLAEEYPGSGACITGVMTDVTELRAFQQRIERLTHQDPLTGLLHQRAIAPPLDRLLRRAERHRQKIACLCLGVDGFSRLKVVYGRDAGDEVLLRLAETVQETLEACRPQGASECLLALAGEDRFFAVVPGSDPEAARGLAGRILEAVAGLRFSFRSEGVRLGARIGIAAFPGHGRTADRLLSQAELALEHAREGGSDPVHVLGPSERLQTSQVVRTLQLVHRALDEDRLVVHFQPVLELVSGRISHYEALVRIREPGGELIPPGRFIDAAERFGTIGAIDERVLRIVLGYLAELREAGSGLAIAVNLSGTYVGGAALPEWLERQLGGERALLERLIFEITETAAIRDIERARRFMDSVRATGCRFALDDFGSGFASFAHLRYLPVDSVKIDGSFVRNLHVNPRDRALVQAMTRIAKIYNKTVVAEFVENEDILEWLQPWGVDYAQGFHIGRPRAMSPQALARSANKGSPIAA